MKNILLFSALVLNTFFTYAQTSVDSLKHAISLAEEDTSKVRLMAALANTLFQSETDTAIYYTEQVLSLAQRLNDKRGMGDGYHLMSDIYEVWGSYPRALDLELKALKIFETLNQPRLIGWSYMQLGNIKRELEDNNGAMEHYRKALAIMESIKHNDGVSGVSANIGRVYFNMGVLDSALVYSERAYQIMQKLKYRMHIAGIIRDIGKVHEGLGNDEIALGYYRLALRTAYEVNNLVTVASTYFELANFYNKTGLKDSSVYYGKKAIELSKQRGGKATIRDASLLLTDVYKKQGKFDSAFAYQQLAMAIKDSLSGADKFVQFQTLNYEEKLRQQELERRTNEAAEQRRRNMHYSVIAIGTITFVVLFLLLSRSIVANEKIIKFLGVLALLIVFEFINLLLHPFLGEFTHHSPLLMLLIMVAIAALLIPTHHRLEKWLTHRLVEKNKKIRLEAAKKTIVKLEGNIETNSA
jgi:tetratricopeptide (TPR) repeat protein